MTTVPEPAAPLVEDPELKPLVVTLWERRDGPDAGQPVATCGDLGMKPCPSICDLARKLIAEGVEPGTPMSVIRGRTKVFAKDMSVGWWAEHMVSDENRGLRLRRFRSVGATRQGGR